MADHLEFLRTVPGPNKSLGPVPPLDPLPPGVPPRIGEPDPVTTQRRELEKRLAVIGRERNAVVVRMRRDHRHFVELEACAAVLVDAMANLERHRLAHLEESGDEH